MATPSFIQGEPSYPRAVDSGAEQLAIPLIPLDGIAEMPYDFAARESGSRPAVCLMASDMAEYYCKGPSLMPQHPFVGVNEWITGRLARLAGVPVRAVELIRWQGEIVVGTQFLEGDRKMAGPLTPETWGRLKNAPAVAYNLVVLDCWTLNTDRHSHNWLGGVLGGGSGWFLANDHDMALMGTTITPEGLAANVNRPLDMGLVPCEIIRNSIKSPCLLRDAIEAAQRISDVDLWSTVSHVPRDWLTDHQKDLVTSFLKDRRDRLGSVVADGLEIFPNLAGREPNG